ncbi:hypothetical protein GCM10011414_20650 [Croceivirga lutea]|uniref:four-carbon acid sugar kinase family protein n=1 Tax=Croceivirga lutea TaxID=1775167 RepID=UPI00163A834C|nr:four-carbon acid sugar kinase family protein [Croceivirga lutea]GGG50920.1 hypothetical protein GCM10011414_20650 [Croceivirga lutea]
MNDQTILASIKEGERLKGRQREVCEFLNKNPRTIVILDDDPTGTQTVQNIPVITNWSEEILALEMQHSSVFFVLTNSRALQKSEAVELAETLGKRLKKLATTHDKKLIVISRGDSTLRGHYPDEVEVLAKALGHQDGKHALIPAFFEGGRFTYKDIHYVREEDHFVPAAETPFAKDSTFGYNNSNLHDYVLEKYQGDLTTDKIVSASIDTLRSGGVSKELSEKIRTQYCIVVNATVHADLENFALAALRSGQDIVFRTAASFVNAILGQRPANLLDKTDIVHQESTGGLIVIGSYVPKTTAQLNILKNHYDAEYVELDVNALFTDAHLEDTLAKKARLLDDALENGKNIVVYTSRKVKTGSSKEESLAIVNVVSQALTKLVEMIGVQPRFILAKGGITSSDIAVKSLNIQRARVLGQLIKGVPVWQANEKSKFPAIPYIVFPGNVGSDYDLYNALKKLE